MYRLVLRPYDYRPRQEFRHGYKLEIWCGCKLVGQHYSSRGIRGLSYLIKRYSKMFNCPYPQLGGIEVKP